MKQLASLFNQDINMTPINEDFPKAIIHYMKENGLTIKSFSKFIGYSPFTVFAWITSHRLPLPSNALTIAKKTKNRITLEDVRHSIKSKYVYLCITCCEEYSKLLEVDLKYVTREYNNEFTRPTCNVSVLCWKCDSLNKR